MSRHWMLSTCGVGYERALLVISEWCRQLVPNRLTRAVARHITAGRIPIHKQTCCRAPERSLELGGTRTSGPLA
jgi:hypothetical protein